ncbi:MAG: XdhC family protein [Pseudonocardiaceae bacterium]
MSTDDPLTRRQSGEALRRWADEGRPAAVVRVLERHGFGTVEPGQLLAGTADGERAGALLAGTLDEVALPLLASAVTEPATALGHVTEPDAVAAGLACSGGVQLLGHPMDSTAGAALGAAVAGGIPAALASTTDGRTVLVATGPALADVHGSLGAANEEVLRRLRELARRGATATERIEAAGTEVLVDLWIPVPEVLLVGSGAMGEALAAQAGLLGWPVRTETGLDAALAAVAGFTAADVLVLLDHAPAFDALLVELLRSGRGFASALGSRHTQAARRQRLLAAGLTEAELGRLHGPVGLDLGAATPAESAVSVVAEVIATRSGRTGAPLGGVGGRIGG